MRWWPVVALLLLAGCGTTGQIYRVSDGQKTQIYEVKLNKTGAMSYREDGVEIQMDSRTPTLWERFITPVLTGAAQKAQTSVQP